MTELDARSVTDTQTGLGLEPQFCPRGVDPFSTAQWQRVDVIQKNRTTGEVIFDQRDVEFPVSWSMNAITIVTTKYFRGQVGTDKREWSLKQLVNRVVDTYVAAGTLHGYFKTVESAEAFACDLKWLLVHQYFSFNSPVWFNVGTTSPQQVSACFILSVDDSMESILNWYKEEGFIFKGGSGAGLNLSRIRSSKEHLSTGGTASGPVSFMHGADASAGSIKSGGATRRAAKMVVLNVDHPDIEEFVQTKVREEEKIRILRDAGFDMELGGRDAHSVSFQNANNSVRVTDEFMSAVRDDQEFDLHARLSGDVVETVKARELFNKIAQAAWECADPGLQYDTTINHWHTNPETGPITASNPCSEYMSLDNSSCNLASLNLLKFYSDGEFQIAEFVHAVELIITAMDISICFADFPTEAIAQTTRDYRQLGIGYANLGALLMTMGLGYDSDEGRTMAAAVTSLMTGAAYRQSAELAAVVGPYAGHQANADAHLRVMNQHATEHRKIKPMGGPSQTVITRGSHEWSKVLKLGMASGFRNAQASVIAPTGTIGFMMDCDTTGIEPDFSLTKYKKLVGGGDMQIVNQCVPRALNTLGYDEEKIEAILDHVKEHNSVVDAPGLKVEHYEVFDCAVGERALAPMSHVRMMAAAQPFISGAISKTVNMPEEATADEIRDIYMRAWEMGIKALAVYRDNCKVGQPLSGKRKATETKDPDKNVPLAQPVRKRLPMSRDSRTTSFKVGDSKGYMTAGQYDDGRLGEVFLRIGKQGSTLSGFMDAFAIAVSIGLSYGVPLETFVDKFVGMEFEPKGFTKDPDVRMAKSVYDYVFKRLALDYLDAETRQELNILTAAERKQLIDGDAPLPDDDDDEDEVPLVPVLVKTTAEAIEKIRFTRKMDLKICGRCGGQMRPSGACEICPDCGTTSGCS